MPRWGRFKDLLNLRFGPPLRAAPLFELAECRRSGTMEEYSNRFQALLPRAGRLDEIQRVQLYTGGLLPPLSHAVRIHNPETLAAVMSLARQIELMESDRPAPAPARPAQRGLLPAPAPRPASVAPLSRVRSRHHRWASLRPTARATRGGWPQRNKQSGVVLGSVLTATKNTRVATTDFAGAFSSLTGWRSMTPVTPWPGLTTRQGCPWRTPCRSR
jgi:hypothetical protein